MKASLLVTTIFLFCANSFASSFYCTVKAPSDSAGKSATKYTTIVTSETFPFDHDSKVIKIYLDPNTKTEYLITFDFDQSLLNLVVLERETSVVFETLVNVIYSIDQPRISYIDHQARLAVDCQQQH